MGTGIASQSSFTNVLEASSRPRSEARPAKGSEDIYERIRRIAQLRDEGHTTAEEFEAKKRELLDRL